MVEKAPPIWRRLRQALIPDEHQMARSGRGRSKSFKTGKVAVERGEREQEGEME